MTPIDVNVNITEIFLNSHVSKQFVKENKE